MEFQAIVVIGFRFANITNKPNKSTFIRNLMATCSFYREIVLPVCLKIRRDTTKCIFSSFPVFGITNGAFRGILRSIALCRDRQCAQRYFQVNSFGRDPWMFPYEAYFVSLPIMSFQCPAVGLFVWVDEVKAMVNCGEMMLALVL